MALMDPYSTIIDLYPKEEQHHLLCPNCSGGNHTVFKAINIEDFNYSEWEAKANLENMNSKTHVKLRVPDAIRISKMLHAHPSRVFNELVTSYWSAWDWEACEQIAIEKLKLNCYNCGYDMEYLKRDYINESRSNASI